MFHTPGRVRPTAGVTPFKNQPASNQVPEGPILEFIALIEQTSNDDWQRRVLAFENIVRLIPDGTAYLKSAAWFNTPKSLWHLVHPISALLRDPRSSVVRRVCIALLELFNKCQSDARLLFKDIMPTILIVQAQTVQIIRTAVTSLITEAIPQVPCKSVMPFWMDRLKDKSPAVRDACSLYLGLALQFWTEDRYLTDEIWMQVGAALLKTMRDPSPTVRQNTKNALEMMRNQHPHRWEALVSDPNGPAAQDAKLQQWLRTLGSNYSMDTEDLSIASKYTYNSESKFIAKPTNNLRISSPRLLKLSTSVDDDSGPPRYARTNVPFSIAVTHSSSHESGKSTKNAATDTTSSRGLGPPLRLLNPKSSVATAPFSHVTQSPAPATSSATSTSSAAATIASTALSAVRSTPPRPPSGKPFPSPQAQTYSALAHHATVNDEDMTGLEYSESSTTETDLVGRVTEALTISAVEDSPFIASMHELKKHASKRRSRNSLLMQQRFRNGNKPANGSSDNAASPPAVVEETSSSEVENKIPNGHSSSSKASPLRLSTPRAASSTQSVASTSTAPEHIVIAIRLLRAHKSHVDQIMETLKLEMDTLRDFDRLLEEPGRPSEEELVNYYESIDLCLEQRLAAGFELRREMNRISAGDTNEHSSN